MNQADFWDEDFSADSFTTKGVIVHQLVNRFHTDSECFGGIGNGHNVGIFSKHHSAPLNHFLDVVDTPQKCVVCFGFVVLSTLELFLNGNVADDVYLGVARDLICIATG